MLYSIRMRAAQGGAHENGGQHISGAECLLPEQNLSDTAGMLIQRALHHSKGKADFIRLTIENIAEETIQTVPMLKMESFAAADLTEGHNDAVQFLQRAGISRTAIDKAMYFLTQLKENMRGAVVMDAQSGKRIDDTGSRGIRVTKMDFKNPARAKEKLNACGFTNIHVHEAIVLASKVLSAPGVIGELCWSDDPDYIIGYVSANGCYHRITKMKPLHSNQGGRAFFVKNGTDINALRQYLEQQVVLVDETL